MSPSRARLAAAPSRRRRRAALRRARRGGGGAGRLVFERALDPILVYPLDEAGRPLPFLDVNDAALRLYGYSREEMLRMSSLDLVDPQSMNVPEKLQVLAERSGLIVRALHVAKDGHRIPVETHAHLFEHAGRRMVLAVCRDLTERHEAEAAVRERERRLAEILENVSDSFVALDRDWRIVYVNRLAAAAVGKRPADLVGKDLLEEYPAYRGTDIERAAREAFETGEPVHLETYSPVTERWLEGTFYPTPDGLSVFSRDVSVHKEAQHALRRQSERLRALAEATLAVTQAPGLEGKLQVVTDEARRVLRAHQAVTSLTAGPHQEQAIHTVSLSEKYAAWREYSRPPDGSGIYTEVCRTNRPMRLTQAELEAHPAYRRFGPGGGGHPPLNGWLAVPLIGHDGRNLGLIQLSDKEDGDFSANDEAALTQLAQFASAALESARTEAARLEAAERFRVIVSQALVGVAQTDLDGRFTYVNDRFAEIVGYDAEDLLGRSMQELTHPDDLGRNLPAFHKAASGGAPFVIEKRYVRKDGSVVWVSNTVRSLLDPEGRPFAILAVVLDVTDRRAHEEALRESEMQLRLALEAASLGTIEVDLDSGDTRRSPRHDQIFGYDGPAPRWTREFILDHVLPEDRAAVEAAYQHARDTLTPWRFACRIRRADGEVRWIEAQGAPLPRPEGAPPRMLGIVADVTERREQEEAVRESEARYRALTELAPNLVYTARPDGSIDFYNQRWFDYTGMAPGDPFDEWVEAVHPAHRQRAHDAFIRAIRTGTEYEAEIPLRGRNGAYRWHLDRARPIRDEHGEVVRWIGVAVDTHDRAEAQEQLKALNATLEERVAERTALAEERARQVRRLAAEVTRAEHKERRRLATTLHDHLQQLLAAAQFHLQLAEAAAPDPTPVQKVHELVAQSLGVSRSLTVQLSPPVLHDGGLGPALGWLARWMEEHHGLAVGLDADPAAEPEDEHVRVLLFEATREALFNVVKHAGVREAAVRLALENSDTVAVTVADEGVGFSPAPSPPSDAPLLGLGLPTVRERMGYVGGTFDLTSHPGQGTRVTFTAPRTLVPLRPPFPALAADPSSAAPAPGAAAPLRVLLVDDHAILRAGIGSLLRAEEGIEVVGEAADGVEAVDLALALRPDVVVMDITMPRMNGIEATRQITAKLPGVRVVGLSMHTNADMGDAIRTAGAAVYVEKGGPPKALVAAIRGD